MDEFNNNDFDQEQGIMELDPTAHDPLSRGPLTPMSQPDLAPKSDHLRMSMEDSDSENKVKFSSGVREITPQEGTDEETAALTAISGDDHEAMKNAIMEPVGDLEVLHEGHFTWEIHNYSKFKDRTLSQEYELGGYKWRVLYFAWGNSQKENASAYVEAIPPDDAPPDWYICAQFAISIWNPTNPTVEKHQATSHRFYSGETDWGFTHFLSVRNSFLRAAHNNETVIAKGGDRTNITVYLRIVKDTTGVLWHNFKEYDSRKQTGYAGLRNQGATCYMNSLLQSLYFTNAFRKIVFRIPTDGPNAELTPLALALQRVFVQLQTSPDPVPTNLLTQAFGWDSVESFVQHDAQEFERILLEGLENGITKTSKLNPQARIESGQTDGKLAALDLKEQLKKLFCGKMESYIRCVNVDYESRRGEEFWDLQLNVKGTKDLRASFEDLVAVEMMDGDNQYRAEGYGLQDAEKGVTFLTFPPVLHLQLKRFEYDFTRDIIVKINDRYEFPLEIDLSEFLAPSADKSVPYNYKLHGVLVHSGDVHGGHYFGMIKPEKSSDWYRYDDERVIPVSLREVLEENYGGGLEDLKSSNGGLFPQTRQARQAATWKRMTSAYMLVYLREDVIDELLAPITRDDVPAHVIKMVEEERLETARRRKEQEEMHLYMSVRVIDVETFRNHDGLDLGSFDANDRETVQWLHSYRVRRDMTWAGLYAYIAERNHLPRDHIRLWNMVNRQNRTVRPDTPISIDTQGTLEAWLRTTRNPELRLYMEKAQDIWHPNVPVLPPKRTFPTPTPPPYHEDSPPPQPQSPLAPPHAQTPASASSGGSSGSLLSNGSIELEPTSNGHSEIQWPDVGKSSGVYGSRHDAIMILIFLKWFDVENQRIQGQRPIYINRGFKTNCLVPIVSEMMGWHADVGEPPVQIAMYEEIKPGMIEALRPNQTFSAGEIGDGDIIVFMRPPTPKRYEELLREGKYVNPVQYYDFLTNKVVLKFLPRYPDQMIKEEFKCVLTKNMKYEQIQAAVADHLHVQPTHIRLTASSGDGKPKSQPLRRIGPYSAMHQLTSSGQLPLPPIAFYEVLELSLLDMEQKRELTVYYLPDGVATQETVTMLVPRTASFEQVLQTLVLKKPTIPTELHDRLRIFDVRGHKEYREYLPSQAVSAVSLETTYGGPLFYVEPIPLEEEEMSEQDRCIVVVHFAKEFARLHGVPVKFVIKPREMWYDTKKRLQKRLGYKDKDYAKIKFYFVPEAYYNAKLVPLEEEDVIYDKMMDKFDKEFIALDHPDRTPGRKTGMGEKALTIKS